MEYKILTFQSDVGPRAGVLIDGFVHDAARLTGLAEDASVLSLVSDWGRGSDRLCDAATKASSKGAMPLAEVKLRTPLLYPSAIYCAGANYRDHAEEMARLFNRPIEPDPHSQGLGCFFFMKTGRTATDPGAEIAISHYSKTMDWEIELAVIIGRTAARVSENNALDYVAGYTVANDLSARDFGRRPVVPDTSPFKTDWLSSKNFDNSCPLGPWVTPAEYISDPHNLAVKLTINGVTKQESNTGKMIFNINEQIAQLSSRMTLYPGDVILTGTPAGVGVARKEFLKAGDVVTCSIEKIGELTSKMS